MRATQPQPSPPPADERLSRQAAVRALAFGRNDAQRAERVIGRALAAIENPPADASDLVLAQAWAARWPRRRRPLFTAEEGSPGAELAGLDADARMAVVLDVWFGWDLRRIARALDLTAADTAYRLRAAVDRLGLHDPDDRQRLRDFLSTRAACVLVTSLGWVSARAKALRRQRRTPLLAASAGAGLLVSVALLGGGTSLPTPTFAPLAPARPLVAEGPVPPEDALPGPALSWDEVSLPDGVSLAWVRTFGGGFVGLEAEAGLVPARTGPITGVWVSGDGRSWQRIEADLGLFDEEDVVTAVATGPDMIFLAGGRATGNDVAPVESAVVWESADGQTWRRRSLPVPEAPAAPYLDWSAHVAAVATDGELAIAVGLALRSIDLHEAVGRRLPEKLPPGFALYPHNDYVTMFGPGGVKLENLLVLGVDLPNLQQRQHLTPMVWIRGEDGAWAVAEPAGLADGFVVSQATVAGERFWATGSPLGSDEEEVYASADGRNWERRPIPGGDRVGAVVEHPQGLAAGSIGLTVLTSNGGNEWLPVRLPDTRTSAAPEGMAGGEFGLAAFGTMGGSGGQVVTPSVTIPGRPAPVTLSLDSGTFDVPLADGTALEIPAGERTVKVDFDGGTFDLLDRGSGDVRFTGSLADWNAAVEGAYRSPSPPTGPVTLWYSPDGARWSPQGPDEGLGAIGYPVSVAVGEREVVVVALGDDGVARVWVGR